MIWRTPNPGLIRGTVSESDGRVFQLILDGQQRLTSIYALATGEAPPFYEGESLYFDIHFNVKTEEFSYFKPMVMKSAPEWLPVTKFLKAGLGEYLSTGGPLTIEDRDFLLQFFQPLQRLEAIKSYTYYLDSLGEHNMDEVVRIFNLVNSKGTRLSKSDLALSHICALWPEARQTMRATQTELANQGFTFGLDFYVRLTASVATGSGFYEPLYRATVEEIQNAWSRAKSALEYLLNVLKFDALVDSAGNLASDTVLVPLVVHLANGTGAFDDERTKRAFLHWMYAALMWARYSGSAETKLNQDLEALRAPDPLAKLRDNIIAESGRIRVEARDLMSRTSRSPFYNMAYVVARSNGAVDWFNGLPLYSKLIGRGHGLEAHHIFPQAQLYKTGRFNSNSTRDRDRVNEIANIAFLTKQANLRVGSREPASYLPTVPRDALAQQHVPEMEALWEVDRYEDFLAERRERLAESINQYMDGLLADAAKPRFSIADYISAGESETVEFKGSLRWDFRQGQVNKALEKVIAKTVAAFMNSNGGTLIVGVSDEGEILGIEPDLITFGQRSNQDGWEQALRNVLNTFLSKEVAALVDLSFADVDQKTVALVHASPARRPVYLMDGQTAEFLVRSGNTTQQLNIKQAHDFIRERFQAIG